MAGKYGRLFTEAEMGRAAIYAATRALGLPIERSPDGKLLAVVTEAERAALDAVNEIAAEATFPADEPLFLLRGQDAYAFYGVAGYREALQRARAAGLLAPTSAFLDAVKVRERAFARWQTEHSDRLKVPD